MTPTRPSDPALTRRTKQAAIEAWLGLYGGDESDVSADVGRFYDHFIAPTLATERRNTVERIREKVGRPFDDDRLNDWITRLYDEVAS